MRSGRALKKAGDSARMAAQSWAVLDSMVVKVARAFMVSPVGLSMMR
jgi:hypothetical protein